MENQNTMRLLTEMPKRIPEEGTFELTVRCNLHCKMCLFRHDDRENNELMAKELTATQWVDIAKQAAEAGTLQLLITGGEPMLRRDFCEIWEEIYKCGFIIELYTNATLVTPKIMETLRKYPPHMIGITIYGSSPETYEKVCGTKEAFKRMVEGVHCLQTLPSIISYRTTIIRDNVQDLSAMEALLKNEFKTANKLTNTRMVTKAVRGACSDVETCRLSAEESFNLLIERAKKQLLENEKESIKKNSCMRLIQFPKAEKKHLTLLGCEAGMRRYTITWDGKLQGCQILGVFSTDALSLGFQKAWEDFPSKIKLPSLNSHCVECNLKDLCECCYAFRYSETGDLQGIPEYICQNTKITNEALRRKIL